MTHRFVHQGDNYGVNNFGSMHGNNYFGQAREPVEEVAPWGYEPVEPDGEDFDIAFSFAAADRLYVERTRQACGQLGLRVMYDRDFSNQWWGKNFIAEQRKLYGTRSRFFVPFISADYLSRPVPGDEFAAAMWEDIRRGGGYILPVLIGGVRVPTHVLPGHIGFLNAEEYAPEALAEQLRRKVDR